MSDSFIEAGGPRLSELLLSEALAAVQAGRLTQAFAAAERALSQGVEHPLFFKLRGFRCEQQGLDEEAAAAFRRVLQSTPDDFAALAGLGLSLAKAGRAEEGLAALDSSLAINADYAPVHLSRGWVLENLGDLKAAEAAYERALALSPDNPRPLASLAAILARSGEHARARELAQKALAIDPVNSTAEIALATAELGGGEAAAAERRLRTLVERPQLSPQERGVALTGLGDALDAEDRPSEAFEAYTKANQAIRALNEGRFGPGRAETSLDLVRRLTAWFEAAEPWAATEPGPSPAAGHVFVVGFPRSGTTLLGQILAAHPHTATLDEQETLAEPAQAFMADAAGLDRLAALGAAELAQRRKAYWERVQAATGDLSGKVLVDKLPMNTLGLPIIARLFPDARIVFLNRDPRDVALSCFRRQFVVNATNWEFLTLEGTARFYEAVMTLREVLKDRLGLQERVQSYEDLVEDFEGETRALCSFAGLEWSDELRDFAARAEVSATPSGAQVAKGLYSEGVGQWRRYKADLEPVLDVLEPWAAKLGYGPA